MPETRSESTIHVKSHRGGYDTEKLAFLQARTSASVCLDGPSGSADPLAVRRLMQDGGPTPYPE